MLAACLLCSRTAPVSAESGGSAQTWVWGGSAAIAFNPDALVELGIEMDAVSAVSRTPGQPGRRYDVSRFEAMPSSNLAILRRGAEMTGIGEGALRFRGGPILRRAGERVDLRGFQLRASTLAPQAIEVTDASGVVWFTADHAHFGFSSGPAGLFSMRHMNLRLSAHFADMLGQARWASRPIGDLSFESPARADPPDAAVAAAQCSAPWPGPDLRTDIQLVLGHLSSFYDSIYAPRCGLPPLPDGGACTTDSTNGKLVLGPDASLRNAGQTTVPWHAHFSGDFPPYGNDQHPYLIWNLYRIDAAGRIKQIGASGVKHAFYSVNVGCGCPDGNVIYPGCEDVYSLSSNDNGGGIDEQNLGPRSEIVPQTGRWGRCGSVWDANCDGVMDAGSGAQDLYRFRMQVDESDLLPPLNASARYFFEYAYIVRDNDDPDGAIGYREIAPVKQAAAWTIGLVAENGPQRDFFQGPVIDAWVDPQQPSTNALSQTLSTPLGRARVAVKVADLGDGRWRYEYAVMNLDYAHVAIDPAHAQEPNLRLLSNHGFATFSVPVPAGVQVSQLRFDGSVDDPADDWTAASAEGTVTWTATSAGDALDWGRLFHFEFVADAAPAAVDARLSGAPTAAEAGASYPVSVLGPVPAAPALRGHSRHARPPLSPPPASPSDER